ncbi:kinase-like domain-containing protein [Mycena latifolia]|nr:kinase-like domain-containing protein [Mycena latifolia]
MSQQGHDLARSRLVSDASCTDVPCLIYDVSQKFCREALVWQALRHKYILPLIDIDRETFPSFCLVSPWMKHGTILKYLSEHRQHASIDKLISQVAEGLGYLHSKDVVHGDLRGVNILVSDDGDACSADFGLSSACEPHSVANIILRSTDRAGSARWFAPELIFPTDFGCERFVRTTASDVYAFACVCLQLHTGKPPFSEVSEDMVVLIKVSNGERPARPESMSDVLWAVVTKAWAQDFHDRPNIHTIATTLSDDTT